MTFPSFTSRRLMIVKNHRSILPKAYYTYSFERATITTSTTTTRNLASVNFFGGNSKDRIGFLVCDNNNVNNTHGITSRRPFSSSSSSSSNIDSASVVPDKGDDSSSSSESSLRFVSHLKNPIVHQLWTARHEAKAAAAVAAASGEDFIHDIHNLARSPNLSKVAISYPFSTDQFLKETYRNPWGQMRFGKLLEDLDALAGNIAFAHVQDPNVTLVTASVDKIRLSSTPNLDRDQHLSGNVTYVGSSSMEIRIQCSGDDCQSAGSEKFWMEAYFTFVATDPTTKRPVKIPPLQPTTETDIKLFEAGEHRAIQKKEERKKAKLGIQVENDSNHQEVTKVAKTLMEEAGPLLNMPSLANPNSILIKQTELQNAEIAQPQARNTANKIFGGFLMRRACELAYSTAYAFGGALPIFYEVDEVTFGMPVNVGDLKNFHARVLHTTTKDDLPNFDMSKTPHGNQVRKQLNDDEDTRIPLVTIEVEAWIIDPTIPSAKLSNQFYFTFAFPAGTSIRKVLPSNMDEARIVAQRIIQDQN